jgi:cytoskeletal protein CcmA (bactofilin family)
MFNKKDNAPATAPMPAPMQQKRVGRSAAPSIISSDLVVNGSLSSTGDIQIDGRVEGDVQSAGLVIGDKAFVNGEVMAEDITIRGRVQGSIRARKVLLCSTSHVEGNILHEAFAVETGAFFEGNCRHHDNPLSEDAGARRTVDYSKPAASTNGSFAPTPIASTIASPTPVTVMPRPMEAPRPAATVAPLKSGA